MYRTIYESSNYILPEATLTIFFVLTLLTALIRRRGKYLPAYMALLGFAIAGIYVFKQFGVSAMVFSGMYAVDPFNPCFLR